MVKLATLGGAIIGALYLALKLGSVFAQASQEPLSREAFSLSCRLMLLDVADTLRPVHRWLRGRLPGKIASQRRAYRTR